MTARKPQSLTPKQRHFVDEYLVNLNATQAAIRAGYSPKTAYSAGQRLLKNVEIVACLQQKNRKRATRTEIDADRVLLELARIAFFDPRALFDADGRPRSIEELDEDTAAAIAGLDVSMERTEEETKDGRPIYTPVRKYKISDKLKALELLMRHQGMLNDKLKVEGHLSLAQLVEAAGKKHESSR